MQRIHFAPIAIGLTLVAALASGAAQGRSQASVAQPPVASPPAAPVAHSFAQLDKDGDGRVSSIEASADSAFDSTFSAMDGNGDGFISADEYRAHAKATAKPKGAR